MIRRLLAGGGAGLVGQVVRYTAASGIALVLDFGIFFGLRSLGLGVYPSNVISVTIGAVLGYWLCLVWVFADRRVEHHGLAFGTFLVIGLIGLAVNNLVLWFGRDVVELPRHLGLVSPGLAGDAVCKAVAAVVSFAWNFLARKVVLFC